MVLPRPLVIQTAIPDCKGRPRPKEGTGRRCFHPISVTDDDVS